ncbi:MAG: NAD(P)-binding domain-containing protein, partial [Alistipes sp.]|nr:NAD(P)-binding domain-containing protein [Alistipes sp.]
MKVAIIGAGNMGGAIARGLVRSGVITPADMALTVKSEVSLKDLRKQNAEWRLSTDNREAVEQADVVILAVKPWLMEEVIAGLCDSLSLDRQIVVSVAAGPTLDDLRRWLRADEVASAAVFRAIPNTAVEVMSGVTFL